MIPLILPLAFPSPSSWNPAFPWMLQGGVELTSLDKLLASDGQGADRFGWTIDLDGERLLVGAIGNDPNGVVSGSAYVFLRSGDQWNEEAILIPGDGGPLHLFGDALDLDADVAFIGAPNADGATATSGAAYFWQRAGSSWSIAQKIWATDGAADARFGKSVDFEGERAVVGAHWESQAAAAAGAAYVFSRENGIWGQEQKLIASDAAENADFGRAVAIAGDWIAVGAPLADAGGTDSGAVYLFRRTTHGWIEEARLVPQNAHSDAFFGYSLAFSGERLVVGAPQCGNCVALAGSVHVFERQGSLWGEVQELTASDGHPFDRYGHDVALEGETIVVGAPYHNQPDVSAGAFYVWRRCAGLWREEAKGFAFDAFDFDEFAFSVTLQGDTVALGSWRDDDLGSFSGSAYTFRWNDVAPVESFCFGFAPNCPCNNGGGSDRGCGNSTGIGAKLAQVSGSTSTALDDLLLEASSLPAGATAMLFYGGGESHVPFGDGLLCATVRGTRIWRLAAGSADNSGSLSFGPGLVQYSQTHFPQAGRLRACQSYSFQVWYIDPLGPCVSGVNFSNALRVRFLP